MAQYGDIRGAIIFLYTSNEQPEHEVKKTILFILVSKRKNYLGLHFTPKDVHNLKAKSYKTLLIEIIHDLNKWKSIPYSWIGILNIVKMQYSPSFSMA